MISWRPELWRRHPPLGNRGSATLFVLYILYLTICVECPLPNTISVFGRFACIDIDLWTVADPGFPTQGANLKAKSHLSEAKAKIFFDVCLLFNDRFCLSFEFFLRLLPFSLGVSRPLKMTIQSCMVLTNLIDPCQNFANQSITFGVFR